MSDFVHLHCHSEYSLLDGAIRLKDLCAKAKSFNMPAVAVTDHGNMHAALPFFLAAKNQGIKPIIGCEVYVCDDHTDKDSAKARRRHHLVLLAQNKEGYHNLVKLVSHGALYGYHYRPRVDKKLLAQYSKGIVALSACLAGEIPRAVLSDNREHVLKLVEEYRSIYPDRFFLEIQSNGIKEQDILNERLLELSKETKLPLVATNDCHYLNADDYEAHDTLLCVQTLSLVNDAKRMRFDTKDLYYKSPEEMSKDFSYIPEAIDNTVRIATEMCEEIEFDFKTNYFPVYSLPEGISIEEEFRLLAKKGLEKRLETMPDVDAKTYWDRLELELNVICQMGFPAYFLIVQDFINWAKDNDIPVGPGRGSAAGSLVAFALRITNLDPLPYNLLFERFLNIERISLPDIDVDFCERNRHRVIDYVSKKYGADSVAQITTFGTMKAKAVVRDVGRAMGLSFAETNRLAKLIPNDLKITIKKALEQSPDLKTIYDTEPDNKKLLDVSMRLEGLSRHASTHAAGVVISDKPMSEYLPLYRGKRDEVVTQYDMKMVEKVGLVKFDFLGLSTMTLIYDVLENIRIQGKDVPNLDTMPFTDEETYKLYASGETDGIFQVESSGMRSYLRMLKPNCFEDIIAMLALYRPGPLGSGMVDEFIKRKHGEVEVSYPHASLEQCLKDTYGVIVYQEQVMQIAQIVANYTLGGADLLRRAMGKKDPAAMAAERTRFVEGAIKNNVEEKNANEIFDLMEKFAEYGFNKSHSAAYAVISYHTAYLKTHYKTEFMAALLSSQMNNQDKLLKYIAACKDYNIEVDIPNVNTSLKEFSVNENNIIFGLGGIKSVGDEAIKDIVEARKSGEFTSMLDFCMRVNLRKVTKRVLENLIKSGAFDCFQVSRKALFENIETIVSKAQKKQKEKDNNQASLFSMLKQEEQPILSGLGFSQSKEMLEEWTDEEKLGFEKEALGFFLSSHPLQPYTREMDRLGLSTLEDSREFSSQQKFTTAVLITGIKEIITKKGNKMAFCQIEDLTASGECVIFSDLYISSKDLINSDKPLLMEVRTGEMEDSSLDDEEDVLTPIKVVALSIRPLAEACASCVEPMIFEVNFETNSDKLNPERIAQLKNVLKKHKGRVPFHLEIKLGDYWSRLAFDANYWVEPTPELELDLKAWAW
ncbi:DNA polymerase III subunit alpha [Desulfovibrio litoralis]|uniref:DNA polymerase III subunit alpha n=1 Tax=Desulfovibrio litoralis DSM 11393 TaxID=1121455 RepID=A0A1M7SYL6_9BACT|nr:DNA polymerase III subunit alpha [Desulfovibrio litoralis]SHN63518.1 DNA polymerase III, alpha subunit [Desulfovibrio litoralis DSM 11393]